jgi:hypothetical protein
MPLLSTRIFPYFESTSATVVFAALPLVPERVVGVGAAVVVGATVVSGDVSELVLELLEHAASARVASAVTAKSLILDFGIENLSESYSPIEYERRVPRVHREPNCRSTRTLRTWRT